MRYSLGRVTAGLLAVWLALQAIGLAVGFALVGRHGGGPAHRVDVPVHDWFVTHRGGLVGVAKVIATVLDAGVLGAIVVVATIVVLAVGTRRGGLRVSMVAPFVAYLGAEATVYVIRLVIQRPRPLGAAGGPGSVPGIVETSWSFPSAHATASMALFVTVASVVAARRWRRWACAVAVLLAIVVAASRLVLGVHWFSDVATGAILGGIWACAVVWATGACGACLGGLDGVGDPDGLS